MAACVVGMLFGSNMCKAQGSLSIQQMVDAVKNNPCRQSSSSSKKTLINIDKSGTTEIHIYKDGVNNTATGYGYHIHITKERVTRHAGEWDGVCGIGIVDTYHVYDTTVMDKAIKLINSACIYRIPGKKPLMPSKGITQITFLKDGKECLTLNDSPEYRNYHGDFHKLVNQLVELTGGEPEFEDMPGPEPDPVIDPYIYSNAKMTVLNVCKEALMAFHGHIPPFHTGCF